MKSTAPARLNNRVLKINVGFLLSDGPGNSQNSNLDIPSPIQVADDLVVNHIAGPLRLSRTKEGILVQAKLHVGLENQCARCLIDVPQDVPVTLEELFTFSSQARQEYVVHADGILDLAPILRAEVLLAASQRILCRPDCKGLCPECGTNRNVSDCSCGDKAVDPRFAQLKKLLQYDE